MYMDAERMMQLGIKKCVVYLDGQEVENCIEADEVKGYVITADYNEFVPGMDEIPKTTREGQVIIVIDPEENT